MAARSLTAWHAESLTVTRDGAFMTSDQGPPPEELSAVELRGNSFESEYTAIRGREKERDPVENRPRWGADPDARSRLT